MRTIKRAVLFLLVCVLAGSAMQFCLRSPSEFRVKYKEFLNSDCHTVVLGHSLARDGVYPYGLDDGDKTAYNLASPTTLPLTRTLVQDLHEQHGLHKVYLELSFPYFLNTVYDRQGNMLQDSTLSGLMAKYDFLRYLQLMSSENFTGVFFNYSFTPESISRVPHTLKVKLSKDYRSGNAEILSQLIHEFHFAYMGRGYVARYDQLGGNASDHEFSRDNVAEQAIRDFNAIADYCRENDIELIAFTSALPPDRLKNEDFGSVHEFFQQLCDNKDVALFDMNFIKWEYFPRTADMYRDKNGHGLIDFAKKQAELLHMLDLSDNPQAYFESSYQDVLAGIEKYEENAA